MNFLCKMGKHIREFKGFLTVLAWGGAAMLGVLFFTDNLSTAIIVLGISCVMIFICLLRSEFA